MARKFFDNINMNEGKPAYENTEEKTSVSATTEGVVVEQLKPEVFEHEGVKIYQKNPESADVTYYDSNGKEVSGRVVDILFEKYSAPPEYNQQGGEKKGDLQVRNAEYKAHGKEKFHNGKEPEYVVERQDYTEGESYTATIPKEHYQLVRFLRGELRPEEVKPSG
jgi:hypothetical protein